MERLKLLIMLFLSSPLFLQAQVEQQDKNLLYELTPVRQNFDVQFYDLDIEVKPDSQSIEGHNTVTFKAVKDIDKIQLDLFENMSISKITSGDQVLEFTRKENAVFIDLNEQLKEGEEGSVTVYYSGSPKKAKNAPWDGGFVWSKDKNDNPWVGVAVEGLGASSWWPNKDHLSDEPDNGIQVALTVPKKLKGISNGRMIGKKAIGEDKMKYTWKTHYSVDNYNVTLYVGDYVHYKEFYEQQPERNAQGIPVTRQGKSIDVDYYVLRDNLDKAKEHFTFTEDVLETFEFAFGPYPFPKDGFAIVESPYLGMEHQGAIAYGNEYKMGWRGQKVEPYLEFDYLFVHETAHEWWGNNISMDDRAAMWIQESFATYADAFYAYSMYGFSGYLDYMNHYKTLVKNEQPILGNYGESNHKSDQDMYYKGALMLNTLSQLVEDNKLWFDTLKKAQVEFAAPRTVSHDEFINFLSKELRMDLTKFFQQYLETTKVPHLVAGIKKGKEADYIVYKWTNVVEGFDMPIKLRTAPYRSQWIYPTEKWKKVKLPKKYNKDDYKIDADNFYVTVDFEK